ncbi:MAG: hypothetical protein WD690_07635 [Vicinamibacterales bacterium]
MRAVAAIILANLPVRWWGPFEERLPLYRYAWVAALATLFVGFAIGIPGYLAFLGAAAQGFNQVVKFDPNLADASKGWALGSLVIFLFMTPTGLLATYLTMSGLIRFASAFIVDDVRGDLILTGIDATVRRAWRRTDAYDKQRTREKLEGSEMPDRLVRGEQVGRPEVELVVLASRQKPDWLANSYLVQEDGSAFRIGRSFDYSTSAGLRTAYPLTRLRGGEAIRHAIAYEFPPLWRGRSLRGAEINN